MPLQPFTLNDLEREAFAYLNDTPNSREARIETLAARISHELDVRYSEALVIVEKWMGIQALCFPYKNGLDINKPVL